jgi:hypothetical protein
MRVEVGSVGHGVVDCGRLDRHMVGIEARPSGEHRPQDAGVLVGDGHHGLLPAQALAQVG